MQQVPKISFERIAAFAEEMWCRAGEGEDGSHNLITAALHDMARNFDPLRAVAADCSPYLCFAIALVGRQAFPPRTGRTEIALNQLVDG